MDEEKTILGKIQYIGDWLNDMQSQLDRIEKLLGTRS